MFTSSNYSFLSNPLDFEPSEIEEKDCIYEGVSKMSNLFCPTNNPDPELFSFHCKPDVDSIKMFVGQIPQSFKESDLLQLFERFGKVYDLRVLRDKVTGKSKGCCFVTFFTRRAALNAQNTLHNIKILPGMHHPIQMKPADSEKRNDRKLFIGMLSKMYSESDVRSLFSPYGTIEECTVLRDGAGQSKGCAFLTYLTRQSAQNAVKSMHHCHVFEGCSSPIVVKFADTQKDKELRKMHILNNKINNQSQIAVILQQPNPDSLPNLLASSNLLQQIPNNSYINLNAQHPILNHVHLPSASVAGWGSLQTRPPSFQNLSNNYFVNQFVPQNMTVPLTMNQAVALNSGLAQISEAFGLGVHPQAFQQNIDPYTSASCEQMIGKLWDRTMVSSKQVEGPNGANLFIYHLPHDFSDQKLAELFSPYGHVISAKVFIDKVTKLSKCFGFVSYDNVISAKAAIKNLNGYYILGKQLKVEFKKDK